MFSSLRGKRGGDVACIFVHAGAGYHSVQNEHVHLAACNDASKAAMAVLRAGGSATDAVEIAIKVLEDREITNAGYGSNLAIDGVVECDAVIVSHTGQSGGVGAVAQIKNPISLARLLLDHAEQPMSLRRVPPNFLVGQGATDFAHEHGMSVLPIDQLISPSACERWKRWRSDLDKADNAKRGEEDERYGLPSIGSRMDMTNYLDSQKNLEPDRKSHLQAMRAGLFNEGQPMSPPPSSIRQHVPDDESETTSTTSQASMRDVDCTNPSGNSYDDPDWFVPHVPPEKEIHAYSQKNLPSTPRPVGVSLGMKLPERDEGSHLARGCGSESWQPEHGPSRKHPQSDVCNWQDGSSGSDRGETKLLPDVGQQPRVSLLPCPKRGDGALDSSVKVQPDGDAQRCKQPSPYPDSSLPKDQDSITDTVGAIAVDMYGHIVCGASSGGIGMKHRGRIGPAAIVGTGAYVIPIAEGDRDGVAVATVTSGTGEHMATTVAAKTCSDRVYNNQRLVYAGKLEECGDDEAIHGFIKQDFMGHPSVKTSHSTGAIGMLTMKKSNQGIYLYYGHNTDSFALASMHSDESKPVCTMSRSKGQGAIAQGGRAIRYRKKK